MAGGLIGALRVSLSAETAQFEAGMKRAQRTAASTRSSFQKSFGGLGGIVKAGLAGVISGLSIGLIVQGTKAALNYAASLGEVSQQLGVTTKDLQVFRYAAGQAGISQEEMDKGLARLTKSMGDAQAGSRSMIAAFNAIGISVDDIRGKGAGEVFRLMADGLAKIPNAAQRAAVETAIFGRAGQKLDTLLSGGSGAINELAAAAEELGVVLSDEQIQKADRTADKLDALQTVLKAQIAGVVADNASSILKLADALAAIVGVAAKAAGALANFMAVASQPIPGLGGKSAIGTAFQFLANPVGTATQIASGVAGGRGKPGRSVTVSLPPARAPAPKVQTGSIGNFLASGGGGGSRRSGSDDAARRAEEERRRLFSVQQESLRAEIDILRAKKDLATDYSERYALNIQILELEKQGYEAELAARVADGDLKKAEAEKLKLANDQRDAIERQILMQEEEEQRQRDYNMLEAKDFEIKRDILERQSELATNYKDRRDVEMRILDLAYQEERERLERITRESKDWAEIEAARRDLLALSQKQSLDRQITAQNNAGPFESARTEFSDLTDEMENLKVNGIMAAGDALATLATDGFGSFKEAAISAIKAVIAEFIRLQTIKFLFNAIGSSVGGGAGAGTGNFFSNGGYVGIGTPAFATGGSFTVMGNRGVDKNLLSLNGLPIARVSHGERLSVSNDSQRMGGGVTMNFAFSGPVSRETQMQVAAAAKRGMATSNRKGIS